MRTQSSHPQLKDTASNGASISEVWKRRKEFFLLRRCDMWRREDCMRGERAWVFYAIGVLWWISRAMTPKRLLVNRIIVYLKMLLIRILMDIFGTSRLEALLSPLRQPISQRWAYSSLVSQGRESVSSVYLGWRRGNNIRHIIRLQMRYGGRTEEHSMLWSIPTLVPRGNA